MNENSIKWISLHGMDLNTLNLSLPQRLEQFGYAVVYDEFGMDKATKAQLCIYNELAEKEKPNILIISPQQLVYSWYKSLLVELGVDFKFITGSSDTELYFSSEISNLYIMSDQVLSENGGDNIKALNSSGIVWDLMIIDGSLSTDGFRPSLYTSNTFIKTEKLAVFAPYPCAYGEEPAEIRKLIKALLSDKEKSAEADNYAIDETNAAFSAATPFTAYSGETVAEPNITVIPYTIEQNYIPSSKRITEIRTGLPSYTHGGNVFEEYSMDQRKLYLRNRYSEENLNKLRSIDTKLDLFLKKTDEILGGDDNTVIVYFDCTNTMDYIYKALCSVYQGKTDMIKVQKGELFDTQALMKCFEAGGQKKLPRVILATDTLSEKCAVKKITHIINYELPDNPAVLQQRYSRHGYEKADNPEFILFKDENDKFDSRILGKVLAANVYKAYFSHIPTKNIYMNIPDAEIYISNAMLDLKHAANDPGSGGTGSVEAVSRLIDRYNIPAEEKLVPGPTAHQYVVARLEALKKAFEADALINMQDTDKKALKDAVAEKIKQLNSGLAYYDDKMALRVTAANGLKNDQYAAAEGSLSENKYVMGCKQAAELVESKIGGSGEYPQIKAETKELTDNLLPSVLYNVWKYCTEQKKIYKPYSEFIRKYNEGAI